MVYLKLLIVVAVGVASVARAQNRNRIDECLDYYKTGDDFDLASMAGRWYAVYFWPANERLRDGCAAVDFYQLTNRDVDTQRGDCADSTPWGEAGAGAGAGVTATYVSNAGRRMNLTFLGMGEIKTLRSGCGKVYKYLFRKIDENNVVGINCSSGGRGVLYSRAVPTASALAQTVNSVAFMSGREGGPECRLTR
ncbi:hypothetical protein EVAR_17462_1 [Eumeta japonica]|uniref:Uncharacterized protein n=1 Tax=Eumeta variegata TaxID=151549 RepID=A0A4C1VAE2_EUMVA|nr:hypothetical protein EVAR_17462_1 [Eumeta japonica]